MRILKQLLNCKINWGDIMFIKETCVLRFKKLCAEKNITINKLATISGITPSTVYSMFDNNRKDLSIITIKKLCDGLDISLTDFFADDLFYNLDQELK